MWFQNRRTKHKRVQQEGDDEGASGGGSTGGGKKTPSSTSAGAHLTDADHLDLMSDDDDQSDIDLEVSEEEDHHPSMERRHFLS